MKLLTLLTAALLLFSTNTFADNTNILFIVDASGSMKEKVGEQTRMDAAKDVLGKTLGSMPEDANLGLLVYGHRKAKDCTDIEVVSAIGKADAKSLKKTVSGLNALGETPIADSLMRAAAEFDTSEGQTNKIILVTDGLEECKGDPCAAAQAIKNKGVNVAVDVVGFTLGAEEAKAVQCITETTGGKYYGAADVDGLTKALEEAAAPKMTLVLDENFDSADSVATNWTVKNEDDEGYIVEDGTLTLISNKLNTAESPYVANSFRLNQELPDGDWVMSMVFEPENSDAHYFGFTFGDLEDTDKVKQMKAGAYFDSKYTGLHGGFWLTSGTKKTEEAILISNLYSNSWVGVAEMLKSKGDNKYELEISRQKRHYAIRLRAAGVADSPWRDLGKIAVLKPFKTVQLQVVEDANAKDSKTLKVHRIQLHTVE